MLRYSLNMITIMGCVCIVSIGVGCHTVIPTTDFATIVKDVTARTTSPSTPVSSPLSAEIPEVIDTRDGLSEDEAVAVALWNNPDFQATLLNLGLARGDLVQAGLLTNPDIMTFLPVGPKIFELTAAVPLEAFVLRPKRLAIAESDFHRIANELVQNGLTLVRDVRVGFAELTFSIARSALAEEAVKVRKNIRDLSEKRLKAGDISELEVINARADYLRAKADAANLKENVAIARNNLNRLMGIAYLDVHPPVNPSTRQFKQTFAPKELLHEAMAFRPDLRAAELAVQNALERVELAKCSYLQVSGVIDMNSPNRRGNFEIGPGLRGTVPIFDRNQGGILRAEAQVEQAMRQKEVVSQQIALEINNALAQYRQAVKTLNVVEKEVLPALNEAVRLAEKNFERGGASYLFVLQLTTQYLDARARVLELVRDRSRALAELERGVGHRLEDGLRAKAPPAHSEKMP